MKIVRRIAEVRAEAIATRGRGDRIGWVGTSGALHEGHLSLVRHAARETDVVFMFWTGDMAFPWTPKSNPSYPREFDRDAALAENAGVDVLYIPDGAEIYPQPPMTQVLTPSLYVDGLTDPEHLRVVALFMTKFLNLLGGATCFMGEKDWQQLVMMRQVCDDLSLPVDRFVVSPTVRDVDGVPLSSRNVRLTPAARVAAAVIPRALAEAARVIAEGERNPDVVRALLVNTVQAAAPVVYARVVSETLQPINPLLGPLRIMVCADFEGVEILDNIALHV